MTVYLLNGEEHTYNQVDAVISDGVLYVWRTNGCEVDYLMRQFVLAAFPLTSIARWTP